LQDFSTIVWLGLAALSLIEWAGKCELSLSDKINRGPAILRASI